MNLSRLCFAGLPLLLVVVPAFLRIRRQRADERISRFQMFFVWVAAYSMLVAVVGFTAVFIVWAAYGFIPGTASAGGEQDGQYFFNWHDTTYTQVSKATWQWAWFLEQSSRQLLFVPFGAFGVAVLILVATKPLFSSVPR